MNVRGTLISFRGGTVRDLSDVSRCIVVIINETKRQFRLRPITRSWRAFVHFDGKKRDVSRESDKMAKEYL